MAMVMRAGVPKRVELATAMVFLLSAVGARAAGVKLLPLDDPAPQTQGRFGEAIAGLGDIDGDGVGDIAVGAPGKERVVLFSGATRAVIRTLQDPSGLTGNRFGFSVSSAGDVNGDGTDDVAVGAPGPFGIVPLPCLDPDDPACPNPAWGRVLVFSGATGALIRTLVPSASEFLGFGTALAGLGDVTGDGVPDLAVGSPVLSMSFWGEVYAFSGANGAQLWQRKEPPFPNEKQPIPSFGAFLGEVGDLDGDGRRELLVAAPFHDYDPDPSGFNLAGTAHVLSGDDGVVIRTHLNPGPVDGDLFGGALMGVGDQDGDGKDDYVVAERGASLLHLFSGGGVLIRTIASPGNETPDGYFPLARTDDKDGDGQDDFWVGALKTGSVSLLNAAGSLLAQAADPTPGGGRFGASVAATGDLNGDGRREAAVGEPEQAAGGQAGAGRAFVLSLNRPPVADAGPDQVVEAGSGCLGTAVLDGSGSSDPDGDALAYSWSGPFGTAPGVMPTVSLPLGTHVVTLTVDDGDGGTDGDTTQVTVVDATAPVIASLEANPAQLWPPNHRWVEVALTLSVSDECDPNPACHIISATNSEPGNGVGDGNTAPDIEVTGPLSAQLRAERSGGGPGRFYALTVECTDTSGNGATATATVTVPHSQH
jgi:hypothetical protein